MTITYHTDLVQGSEEWLAARRGILTASEMKLIITPTLKIASNEKERSHLYELLAQRVTGFTEPHYISNDMLRGMEEEIKARALYAARYAPVDEVGFITNDAWGFPIGYSPDGLVGDDGAIECKSRRAKWQMQTIVEGVPPEEYVIQLQTGLMVSGRKWIDFVSYCGGLPMVTIRVYPDPKIQGAILNAAMQFEERLQAARAKYDEAMVGSARLIPTEREIEQEMFV
jgi:hypothetical protein